MGQANVRAAVCPVGRSSPAAYDPTTGSYAAYLTGLDVAKRTITFNVIQFLVGSDAVRAFHQANPTASGGPPDDYWIITSDSRVYTARVSPQVTISLVRLSSGEFSSPASLSELPAQIRSEKPPDPSDRRLSDEPYWLTVQDGTVDSICEQYTP